MRSNPRASCPISSSPRSTIGTSKSPAAMRSAALSNRRRRCASIPAAVSPRARASARANAVASRRRFWTRRTVASESASEARKRTTVSGLTGTATSAKSPKSSVMRARSGFSPPAARSATGSSATSRETSLRRAGARARERRSRTPLRARRRRSPPRRRQVVRGSRREPSLRPEAISRAPNGQDQLGVAGITLDLLAQVPDVHVDRPRLSVVGAAAQALEQLAPREYDARARGEEREHLELDERQLDGLAADLDRAPREIDPELAPLDHLHPLPPEIRRRGPAEKSPNPAAELADRERLGDVVVGS